MADGLVAETQMDVRDKIGEGRFGAVRLAVFNEERVVAVKVLSG